MLQPLMGHIMHPLPLHLLVLKLGVCLIDEAVLASYPGADGEEKVPGIHCLRVIIDSNLRGRVR